jgi:hypothetical protein
MLDGLREKGARLFEIVAGVEREFDEGAGTVGTSGCSGRVSNGADEAGAAYAEHAGGCG